MSQNQKEFPVLEPAQRFQNVQNPLQDYLEKQLPSLQSKQEQIIDLSPLGQKDPIFNPSTPLKETLKSHIGKIDGYTDMKGLPQIRQHLAQQKAQILSKIPNNKTKVDENDIIVTFGLESAFWLVFGSLIDQNDKILIPQTLPPFIKPLITSFSGNYSSYINFEDIQQNQDQNTGILIINPMFLQSNKQVSNEQAKTILQKCVKETIPLIVYGDAGIFLENNTGVNANIIQIEDIFSRFRGWKTAQITLYGEGFQEYKKGLINLTNVILMTNTVMQSAFIDLGDQYQQYLKDSENNYTNIKSEILNIFKAFTNYRNEGDFGVLQLSEDQYDVEYCKNIYQQEGILLVPGSFYGLQNSIVFSLQAELNSYGKLKQALEKYKL